MLESAGVPVPGETALIAASVLATQGLLSLTLVIVVAAAAAIIGDNAGYWIGRRAGRRLLERWRPVARYTEKMLPPAERFSPRWQGCLPCPLYPWSSSDRCARRGHRRHGVVALSRVEYGGRDGVGDQRRAHRVWPRRGCGERYRQVRPDRRGGGHRCRCGSLRPSARPASLAGP